MYMIIIIVTAHVCCEIGNNHLIKTLDPMRNGRSLREKLPKGESFNKKRPTANWLGADSRVGETYSWDYLSNFRIFKLRFKCIFGVHI